MSAIRSGLSEEIHARAVVPPVLLIRERPILFSGPMVRAILAGTKTQTRRVLKPQLQECIAFFDSEEEPMARVAFAYEGHSGPGWYVHCGDYPDEGSEFLGGCPYGVPGDRLWVRETWRTTGNLDEMAPAAIATHCVQEAGYSRPWAPIEYLADGEQRDWRQYEIDREWGGRGKTRVSIHMPRWASRITLEITDVRVQRVQEISEEEAEAEGVEAAPCNRRCESPRTSYRTAYGPLWDSLNAKRGFGWEANPWVWAITFRRIAPETRGDL